MPVWTAEQEQRAREMLVLAEEAMAYITEDGYDFDVGSYEDRRTVAANIIRQQYLPGMAGALATLDAERERIAQAAALLQWAYLELSEHENARGLPGEWNTDEDCFECLTIDIRRLLEEITPA